MRMWFVAIVVVCASPLIAAPPPPPPEVAPEVAPRVAPEVRPEVPPEIYLGKLEHVPDVCQMQAQADFRDNGRNYCGPAAASNVFAWLADRGYSRFKPTGLSDHEAQLQIIGTLASHDYMRTQINDGTNPADFITGVAAYVSDHGYRYRKLEYRGFRPVPRPFHPSSLQQPDLDWVKRALLDPRGAAWLLYGWYDYDPATDTYTRKDGHYVTLVGYRDDTLIVHDPSLRTGRDIRHDELTPTRLTRGTLTGPYKGLPQPARRYYRLTGPSVDGRERTCILDAAVVMIMR